MLAPTKKASKIVAGWSSHAEPAASAGGGDVAFIRPARLGLGASQVAQKPIAGGEVGLDRAGEQLRKSIDKQHRKEKRETHDRRGGSLGVARGVASSLLADNGEEEEDNEEDVGRSGAFGARAAPSPHVLAHKAAKQAPVQPAAKRKRAAKVEPPEPAAPVAAGGAHAPPPAGPNKDKRMKTRSKQKNLRRDTRPEHLKPSYRTPGAPDYQPPAPPAWQRKHESTE